jgi:hypothetical protein
VAELYEESLPLRMGIIGDDRAGWFDIIPRPQF